MLKQSAATCLGHEVDGARDAVESDAVVVLQWSAAGAAGHQHVHLVAALRETRDRKEERRGAAALSHRPELAPAVDSEDRKALVFLGRLRQWLAPVVPLNRRRRPGQGVARCTADGNTGNGWGGTAL